MNKVAILIITYSVVVENIQNDTNHLEEVELSTNEANLFKEINLDLDNMTQELFKYLSLNQNYTKTTKMKLLELIHVSLRNISESSFNIYNDIKNVSLAKYDNKTINALFNLTIIIEEIFNILDLNSMVAIDVIVNEFNNTRALFNTLKFIEDDMKSDGMIDMMKFFVKRKNSNVTKKNTSDKKKKKHKKKMSRVNNTTHFKKRGRSRHQFYRKLFYNMKPWRPLKYSKNTNNRRVFKGKKTALKRYPFMASIHVMGEFTCSGSIISRELIITSASCLQTAYDDPLLLKNPDAITIRAGSEMTRRGGVVFPVIEIHYHPMYDPQYLANNLAIARIKMELTFMRYEQKMRRILFDNVKRKLPAYGRITILGWGNKDSYTRYAGPLTMARLDVYGLEPCKEIYSEHYVQDTNFCAGFVSVGGGACNKDLGGPGLVDNLLVGVISFGPPVCGTRDAPTVFTKLGFYSEWIEHVIKKVQGTPYKNPPLVSTEQPLNNNDSHNSQETIKQYPPDVLTLKRLFKDYVLSGKININELAAYKSNENIILKAKLIKYDKDLMKNSSTNKPEFQNHGDHSADETKLKIDFNKINKIVESQVTRKHPPENNDKGLAIPNLDRTGSMDDYGDPNLSDSLTDNYELNKHSFGEDDETEEGLSIEFMESTTSTNKPTLGMNMGNNIYEQNPIGPPNEQPGLRTGMNEAQLAFSGERGFRPTETKPNQFELNHKLEINIEKIDLPVELKTMFLSVDRQQTTALTTVAAPINLRGDEDNDDVSTDLKLDPNYYDTLKYIMTE